MFFFVFGEVWFREFFFVWRGFVGKRVCFRFEIVSRRGFYWVDIVLCLRKEFIGFCFFFLVGLRYLFLVIEI